MTTLERIRRRQKIQRIRRIKRTIAVSVMTLVLVAGLALTVNVIKSAAQDKDVQTTYKYFTSVVVEYGDTLYSLAEEHTEGYDVEINEYVEEVIHINHLEDETIQSGQYLVVPYFSHDLKGI